jgi:hypothetical protein
MSITLDTQCYAPTSSLGVRVVIANIGDARASSFVVEVNGAQQTVEGGLDPGRTESLWFAGYIAFEPNTAFADATFLVEERDESNNQVSAVLPIPTPPLPCPTPPTITSTPIATFTATPTATPTGGE